MDVHPTKNCINRYWSIPMWDFRLPCLTTWGDEKSFNIGVSRGGIFKNQKGHFVPPTHPQLQRHRLGNPWDHPHESGKWSWNDSWVMFQPWFPASHFRCGRFQMLHCSCFLRQALRNLCLLFLPPGVYWLNSCWFQHVFELVTWPGYWDAEFSTGRPKRMFVGCCMCWGVAEIIFSNKCKWISQ